ncbi:hypothetical protein [uncultured Tenacibaculum sp.]|uniref:hypothetical protein n=1 Tax=uncultured Tenacibaculum sp. TaxID=174713 RepID=UPI00261F41CA|nr:hypothetical protein [uncultured Tenacibaculum sp.]
MIVQANILNTDYNRDWIHFIQWYQNLLFSIQEDTILNIWDANFKKIASVELGGRFYEPSFQFVGQKLLLIAKRGNRIAIIDFENIENPTVVLQKTKNGFIKGACIAQHKLYIQISETHKDKIHFNFQVSDIPTLENPNPEINYVIPVTEDDVYNGAFYTQVVKNTIYWINQNSIFAMDITNPDDPQRIAAKKIVDNGIGYPVLLTDNRMLVLEIGGDAWIAVNHFDISNNNIKKISKGILKNHCIRGWELIDQTLYIIHLDFKRINKERKYKTYISSIDVSGNPTINYTKELPIIEVYGEDSSTIYGCYRTGESLILIQGNGEIHKISIKKSTTANN